MNKSEIVRELLNKPKFRDMPNQTFARFLREKHPNVFPSIENARDTVRYVKGLQGIKLKSQFSDPEKTKYFQEALDNLPEPIETFTTGHFTVNHHRYKKAGIINDIHIGHHHLVALKTALAHLHFEKIDILIVNGDVFDGRSVSHWERDLKSFDSQYEIQENRKFWGSLRKMFPNIPIIYKFGNHEVWWQRHLKTHCINVSGIPEFQLEIILKLKDFNIDYVPDLDFIKYGKVSIWHGHEFKTKSGSRHISEVNFKKVYQDSIFGDAHRIDKFIQKSPNMEDIRVYNIGCLCNLQAPFRPHNQWSHGFGVLHILDDKGNWELENREILNGKVL